MDWAGTVVLIVSAWVVGDKKRSAFIFALFGNLAWAIYGFQKGIPALVVVNLVFVVFNMRAWFKWGSENAYWNRMVQRRRQFSGKFFWET